MQRFLLKLFAFTLPFILSVYFLDRLISQNLRKSNTYAQQDYPAWNAIIESKLNANIFVYGSSRAVFHFDAQMMEDSLTQTVYNLGLNGQTFNMQYLRHIIALKNNPKPKLIIHSVDIGTLAKGNAYNFDQFLPYMLWDNIFYEHLINYEGYRYVDYKLPLVRYYGKIRAIKTALAMMISPKKNDSKRIKGYEGREISWDNYFDKTKDTMKKSLILPDSATSHLFEHYLAECKNNQIKVILVYAPFYIEGQAFIENQEQILQLYTQLAQKYDFLFIDFTKDEICYDKKYFYNASHMNKDGATLFTQKLCSSLKKLNIQY